MIDMIDIYIYVFGSCFEPPISKKKPTGVQTCDYFEVQLVGRRYICIKESHQSKDFTGIGGF